MLSPDELLKVANAYCAATGVSLTTVGRWSCRNVKIYRRIRLGAGAMSRSIEQATAWFQNNWPENAVWPAGVPYAPRARVPQFTAGRGGARRHDPDNENTSGSSCSASA